MQDEKRFYRLHSWTYQPGNTELGGRSATAIDYLKVLAVSRIMLDNFDNIQASWVTQEPK
jgi:cyclic dehypoxanthinyl futalosine synthase